MTLCSVTQASREARTGKSHPGGENRWSQWQHCQHCLQSFPAVQAEAAPLTPGLHRALFDTSQDFIFIKWLFLSGSCNLIKYQSGLAVTLSWTQPTGGGDKPHETDYVCCLGAGSSHGAPPPGASGILKCQLCCSYACILLQVGL